MSDLLHVPARRLAEAVAQGDTDAADEVTLLATDAELRDLLAVSLRSTTMIHNEIDRRHRLAEIARARRAAQAKVTRPTDSGWGRSDA